MYKKQMLFQKIVCYVMLAACALTFIYSLGLVTDLYDALYTTMRNTDVLTEIEDISQVTDEDLMPSVEGASVYYRIQGFNTMLTKVSIGVILVGVVLFITCTHSRRKYYIGNYVAIGLSTVANVGVSVWALSEVAKYKAEFLQVNFEQLKEYSTDWNTYYTDSTFWFDAGYVVFGILLLVTALLLVNMVLKLIVMKEEKRSIGSRKDVRA